jgi:predicted transcriptional regulator
MYSFLVAKSIERLEQVFLPNGQEICKDVLSDYIDDGKQHIQLVEIKQSKMSKELNMSLPTIINGLKNLMAKGYISTNVYGEDCIYINNELIEHGYFELIHSDMLCGELLIFYSFLLDKSKKYGYCIDTYKSKIAEELGKTKVAITKMLNRLYSVALAKRLPDGKLKILL